MVVNFYKKEYLEDYSKVKIDLLASRNIEHIPALNTIVIANGQFLRVDIIRFNLEKCEYDIYMVKA